MYLYIVWPNILYITVSAIQWKMVISVHVISVSECSLFLNVHMLHTFWGTVSEVFSKVVLSFGNVLMYVKGNKIIL